MVSQGRIGRIAWLNQDDGAAAPVAVTPQSKETEQQMEEKRKAELEALDAELAQLQALAQKLAADSERDAQLIKQLEASLRYEDKQAEALQKQYEELVKVMDLLPDADNSTRIRMLHSNPCVCSRQMPDRSPLQTSPS